MSRVILAIILIMATVTCSRPYHYPGQYHATYPVQIDCRGCHKDGRGKFNHGRGWCDRHYLTKSHNQDVCITCHGEVQCLNCHRDPKTNEMVWSPVKQDRWKRKEKE